MTNTQNFCKLGKTVIAIELKAIKALESRIDQNFSKSCDILLHCKGRVAVFGMGKSGHIAKKIAATLASTGTPAFYIHPSEASHGDMGMLTREDVALAISYSGETPEMVNILPMVHRLNLALIAMTGKPQSSLARAATVHLDISVEQEACSLGLAPTSSTTATLVMGDALAVAVLDARGFTAEDFAKIHPGGILGRKLLLNVEEIMHTDAEMPVVHPECRLAEALIEMTQKSLGMTTVIDAQGKLIGIFTDGDLRRTMDKGYDVHTTLMSDVMTENSVTIPPQSLASDALKMMKEKKITSLVITDPKHIPLGVIHIHDLLRLSVM